MATTSTKGRMPAIAFSDDADYETLKSVLLHYGSSAEGWGWCVAITMKDGTQHEVMLHKDAPDDYIGGRKWNTDVGELDWTGDWLWVPLDDVAEIIVL